VLPGGEPAFALRQRNGTNWPITWWDSVRRSPPELNVQTHNRNFGEAKSAAALKQRFGGQRWSRRESNSACKELIFNKLEVIIF